MKLVVNGQDFSGENSGVTYSISNDEIKLDISASVLKQLITKKPGLDAQLNLKFEKDPKDPELKTKAEILFGKSFEASVDQTGKIEAGIKIPLNL